MPSHPGPSTPPAIRIGVWLPECVPADEVADFAARAEECSFDSVWLPDAALLWRDPWVTAALVAQRTERLRVAIGVTNIETRHLAVLASAIRTVQEIARDRLVVGIGTGGTSLATLGIDQTTRARLGESIALIRALLGGHDVDLGAGVVHLRDFGEIPPLYVAASGPRNLRFAPTVADGVITLGGVTRTVLDRALHVVAAGALEAGRTGIPTVVTAITHVTDDVERDVRLLKPLCAAMSLTGAGDMLADEDIHFESLPPQVTRLYPSLAHAEDWDLAVSMAEEFVSDETALRFAERFCLMGTPEEIRSRIQEMAAAGVAEVVLQSIRSYELPTALLDLPG